MTEMAMSLENFLAEHPVDRERVESHKERMLAEVREYRLRELREHAGLTQAQSDTDLMSADEDRAAEQETAYLFRSPANARRLLDSYERARAGETEIHDLDRASDLDAGSAPG